MNPLSIAQNICLLTGRFLLGLYFMLPAIGKVMDFDGTSAYMPEHNVPIIPLLLTVTIIIQLGAGGAMIVGFQGKLAAFLLAGLTIAISIFMHNFWECPEGTDRAHETQNFFKNMGIAAGLLMISALGTGRFSLQRPGGQKSTE